MIPPRSITPGSGSFHPQTPLPRVRAVQASMPAHIPLMTPPQSASVSALAARKNGKAPVSVMPGAEEGRLQLKSLPTDFDRMEAVFADTDRRMAALFREKNFPQSLASAAEKKALDKAFAQYIDLSGGIKTPPDSASKYSSEMIGIRKNAAFLPLDTDSSVGMSVAEKDLFKTFPAIAGETALENAFREYIDFSGGMKTPSESTTRLATPAEPELHTMPMPEEKTLSEYERSHLELLRDLDLFPKL